MMTAFPRPRFPRVGLPVALCTVLGMGMPGTATAQEDPPSAGSPPADGAAPLFAGTAPLAVRIEADFRAILGDRAEDNPERPGTFILAGENGAEETFPVQIRTRGKFRLRRSTCSFPPLRLNFPRSRVEGSVLDGQDKIKLVTHCRDGDRYEQNVVKEYLAYRLYQLVTPGSFRVRMLRVTYVDTAGEEDTRTRLAFLIEMEEAMAERLGGTVMSDEDQERGIHPAWIIGGRAVPLNLFQYMIGNTDFSIYGDRGLPPHNAVPVEDENGQVTPVPYDFDFSGLVDAPYAKPDPSLGIRNVRQRVFRGLCRPGVDYPAMYRRFADLRPAVAALVRDEPLLADDEEEEVLDYLDDFWETLERPDRARSRIEERCRPV